MSTKKVWVLNQMVYFYKLEDSICKVLSNIIIYKQFSICWIQTINICLESFWKYVSLLLFQRKFYRWTKVVLLSTVHERTYFEHEIFQYEVEYKNIKHSHLITLINTFYIRHMVIMLIITILICKYMKIWVNEIKLLETPLKVYNKLVF